MKLVKHTWLLAIGCIFLLSCNKNNVGPQPTTQAVNTQYMRSMVSYNGNLIVGGGFSNIHGIPYNNIAEWNGTAWVSLGNGLRGQVTALAVFNGNLIAAEDLNSGIATSSFSQLVQWNGSSWDTLPGRFKYYSNNGVINSLAVYNGSLYVGGNFNVVGATTVNSIAKWNDTIWSSPGSGVTLNGSTPGIVSAFAVYKGWLYSGGGFKWANGSIAAGNIAKWNDTVWAAVDTGVNNPLGLGSPVGAVAVCDSNLYAGGVFSMAGITPVNDIAGWNDTAWTALGTGQQQVMALAAYNNNLIAGMASSNNGGGIAQWNGSVWSNLGSGINNNVVTLTTNKGNLYAVVLVASGAGDSSYVAQWNGSKWSNL